MDEDKELRPLLSSFSCAKDHDIESFLKEKAIEFEKLAKSRTYIVFDEQELTEKRLSELTIYGYVSIALKILTVPEDTSNRVRKEIDGYNAKIHGIQLKDFPCYLIGQLSKNTAVKENEITGKNLLEYAESVISTAVNAVGGRYMMIECRNEEKLIAFYSNNGFSEIARIPDQNIPMVQMIRKI